MHQRQLELGKSLQEKKSIPFLSRRQEVALNQWEPISKALSYSRDWSNASVIKRTKTSQLKLLDSLGKVSTDRNELRQQIESWEKNIRQVLRETEQKLASKHNQSIQKNRTEQLYWNLTRNDLIWDDTGKKWKFLEQVKPEKTILVWHDLLGQIDVLISDTMLMSEVEQAKKDQNSLFVKDAGQCGRALIQIQQEVRETDLNASEKASWNTFGFSPYQWMRSDLSSIYTTSALRFKVKAAELPKLQAVLLAYTGKRRRLQKIINESQNNFSRILAGVKQYGGLSEFSFKYLIIEALSFSFLRPA